MIKFVLTTILFFSFGFLQAQNFPVAYKIQRNFKECNQCEVKSRSDWSLVNPESYSEKIREAIEYKIFVEKSYPEKVGYYFGEQDYEKACEISRSGKHVWKDKVAYLTDNMSIDYFSNYEQKKADEKEKQKHEQDKEYQVKQLLGSGKYYYDKEELRNALYYYNKVLSIDKNNYEAYNKKSEIENFFYNRAAGYQYRKLFESNYNYFVDNLKIALEDEISKTENGQAKFTIDISFDTSGINKSTISKTNITDLDNRITSIVNSWLSTKPTKKGYYVKAYDKITIDVSWKSGNSIYTRNSKGSTTFNTIGSVADHFKFIKSLDYPYGKFYFTSKAKKLIIDDTEVNATDIFFTKYEFSGGPLNAFYSLLFPGLGKYKVTNGKKGKNTMLYSGISYLFQLISKGYEYQSKNEYYESTNPSMQEDNYSSANLGRQSFLVLFFSTLGFGLYDTSISFKIGLDNFRNAKKNKQLYQNKESHIVQIIKFNEVK